MISNFIEEIEKAAPETSTALKMVKYSSQMIPESEVLIKVSENISICGVNNDLLAMIKSANTFANPRYLANDNSGRSNWNTSPTIETFQEKGGALLVSRGFLTDLLALCETSNVVPAIEDLRCERPCDFPNLKGISLRQYQQRAVEAALQHDQGIFISPTGSGKTLIGLEIIRKRGQKALIIVHRSELAKQFVDVIKERFGLTAGFIGSGEWRIGNEITVAMVQTLTAREVDARKLSDAFGLILCTEVHHAPAESFFNVLGSFRAKFRYGESATPNRRDGLEPMIYRAIGPEIATISKEEVEGVGAIVPVKVISIKTGFNPGYVNSWNDYISSLTCDASRNMLIIDLAKQAKGPLLILVDRVSHAEQLSEMFERRNIDHVLAHGKIADREDMMKRIKSATLTIGTTSLLGEGLDVDVWRTLIMGAPISSEIKLTQAIGRIVRPSKDKENALVYDLRDDCAFAGSSFNKRFEIYKKNRIWVDFE